MTPNRPIPSCSFLSPRASPVHSQYPVFGRVRCRQRVAHGQRAVLSGIALGGGGTTEAVPRHGRGQLCLNVSPLACRKSRIFLVAMVALVGCTSVPLKAVSWHWRVASVVGRRTATSQIGPLRLGQRRCRHGITVNVRTTPRRAPMQYGTRLLVTLQVAKRQRRLAPQSTTPFEMHQFLWRRSD